MRSRALLLGAQALCLGLSSALLIVAATSVFLSEYGTRLLPYAYIVVAVGGVVVSWAMGRVQRHLSLAGLATSVLLSLAAILAAGWAVLVIGGQVWVTFPLVVLIFLWIPVGFVLVGSQSGRLLDVQQLKAWFPRIAAGFAAGFGIGGLLSARLVTVLGSPEGLLLIDVGIVLVFLALVIVLARQHPDELRRPPEPSVPVAAEPRRPSLRGLLGNRLVVVLLGYQLLSAAVTQLLDYLVWSSAAQRYPDPADLARFLGLFGALINAVGLVFVFTLAGVLLSRYGVRFGLAANPAGVVILVVVSTAVGLLGGAATTAFFVLICAQQVVDIALTDGTTRGSINAAYQALPPRERLAAQTRVEGVGVPAAVGSVGVLLLVAQAAGAGVVALLVVVLVLTVAWLVLAGVAFRLYAGNLRRTISRRDWDPVALRLDDATAREIVQRMLVSDDPRDVAMGLDALAATSPDALDSPLAALLGSPDPHRIEVGVAAAGRHHVVASAPALLRIASSPEQTPALRAAAVRAAADLDPDAASLVPLLHDSDAEVRGSAAVGLLHLRGGPEDLAGVEVLLDAGGPEADGVVAALAELPSPAAVPALVRLSEDPRRLATLVDALSAHAAFLVPSALAALGDQRSSASRRTSVLVRAVASSRSPASDDVLVAHLLHPSLDVRDAVLDALASRGSVRADLRLRHALSDEAERVAGCLDAIEGLDDDARCAVLRRALHEDLEATAGRAVSLLALLHDTDTLRRAVPALTGAERPIALETLEVTLGRVDAYLCLTLVDPELDDLRRRARLIELAPLRDRSSTQWVEELALDPDGEWHDPWLRVCAVWALDGDEDSRRVASAAVADDDAAVQETARAVLVGVTSTG